MSKQAEDETFRLYKNIAGGAGLGVALDRAYELLREYLGFSPCRPVETALVKCTDSLQALYEALLP